MTTDPTSRDCNKASVLDVVLSHAPLTRNKLTELTGLSRATVFRAVEEIWADGFLVECGVDEVTGPVAGPRIWTCPARPATSSVSASAPRPPVSW
ncbi:hypothetical protein [Streptomyces sp. NPDC093598]|uniref:MarR family transcriptional regulator n=1 Tax=Streptomyces sp. NPDC093598 TaxID=3366046 RepID=UPI0038225EBD